jgi:uncharacterized YccA/Bax inhibitor family protein
MATQMTDRSPRMERAFDRMTDAYPLQPEAGTFSAARVYDKVGLMVVLALVTGTYSYIANNNALVVLGLITGFVLSMVGIFRPATAKIVAPLYALAEGLALGGITAYYATSSGMVPLAIIFTGGIFLGAMAVFRTGLVKVTPKFASMTFIALIGFLVTFIAVQVLGLPVPGLAGAGGMVVFGVFGIALGVACLFMDFSYIQMGEQRRLPADGEWYGALMLMISLVFVYINVLRVLGRRR